MQTNDRKCCFILTTGRSGSAFISNLMGNVDGITAFHEPYPQMLEVCRIAYGDTVRGYQDQYEEAIYEARNDLVNSVHDDLYLESQPRLVPYFPYIAKVFPQSKFVYMIRSPAAVVKSGAERNHYGDGDKREIFRIKPEVGDYAAKWPTMNMIEKLSWRYAAINRYIEWHLNFLLRERWLFVKSENLFSGQALGELSNFLGVTFPDNLDLSPKNAGSKNLPEFGDWLERDKEAVRTFCGRLASQYGYILT